MLATGAFILGVLLASAAWAWHVHRGWRSPARAVRAVMKSGRAGDWTVRVEPEGAYSQRKVGHRLNQLLDEVEQQLAGSQRRTADLRALVNALPDPILLADADDKVVLVNVPAADLLGVPPEAAIGVPAAQVLRDRPVLKLFDRTARPKNSDDDQTETRMREVTLVREGRRKSYQALARRSRGGGVLVVLRDVSQQVGTAQMKADFVSNASHELRTPVSAMRLAMETLYDAIDDADDAQVRRCAEIIDGHTRRLGDMVQDLLDLGGIEGGEFQPALQRLTPDEMVAPHRDLYDELAEQKNVTLAWPSDGPAVWADRRLLNLILKNLVENALKFTPEGGRVSVTVNPRELPEEAAKIHHELTGVVYREVELAVADTGIGIAPEAQDRVFERFFQVDEARAGSTGRGTGLGLAIVKHAAGALGGSVALSSRPGKGTTVTVTLAPADAAEPATRLTAQAGA
jgi:two-component system phosphate regulon sensor histidine kinase PhoR